METLTRFSIERWRLNAHPAILLILFSGAYTYLRQPSQEDPEVVIRTAVVTVAFPGMSASRVEQLLIKPVEEIRQADPGSRCREVVRPNGARNYKSGTLADRDQHAAGLGQPAQQDDRSCFLASRRRSRPTRQR